MTTAIRIRMITLLLATALGGTYAFAQAKPAADKPPAQTAACEGKMCDRPHGKGRHGGMQMGMHECPMMQDHAAMPAVTVRVENTARGAKLELTAKNVADVKKIQDVAHKMATHMESGCPMLKSQGAAAD